MILESEFQRALYEALNKGPSIRVWRQNCGSVQIRDRAGQHQGRFEAGAPKGAADLSGIVAPEGLRLEVELKVTAKWTPEQRQWKAFVELRGGIYVLVRWDVRLDLGGNVIRGLAEVDQAITERRAKR